MTLIAWQNGKPVFKNGRVGVGADCCCGGCSGPCDSDGDCAPGCRCVNGQCVPFCCISSTNCQIVVTVVYSNGQTRVSGDEQLDESGLSVGGATIGATIGDCNVVSFFHYGLNTGSCTQYAEKRQKIDCDICCPSGAGCKCTMKNVVSESYDFIANDPGADCQGEENEINHVTSISFSLVSCGCCGCCPLGSADDQGQVVTLSSDCSCKTGSLSGTGALGMFIDGDASGGSIAMQTDCEYEIEGISYFSNAYISVGCCDCEEFGKKQIQVSISAYTWDGGDGFGYSSMSGYECTDSLTVSNDGKIVGTVAIDAGNCNATLTFG